MIDAAWTLIIGLVGGYILGVWRERRKWKAWCDTCTRLEALARMDNEVRR